jgi:hypothetical protein
MMDDRRKFDPSNRPLVDSQRVFINELIDLLRNRYIIRVQYYDVKVWLVKLQHLTNGRKLSLHWKDDSGKIMEGEKVIKQWPLPSHDN